MLPHTVLHLVVALRHLATDVIDEVAAALDSIQQAMESALHASTTPAAESLEYSACSAGLIRFCDYGFHLFSSHASVKAILQNLAFVFDSHKSPPHDPRLRIESGNLSGVTGVRGSA